MPRGLSNPGITVLLLKTGKRGYNSDMSVVEHLYRYACPSSLKASNDGLSLQLAAELDEQRDAGFFKGDLLEPLLTARCLRAVSDLVGTRFYVPPSMLARILREADPVATVAQHQLRFEGFSACCSTYIRHDMTEESFETDRLNPGTTNVDFQADMRAALSKIRDKTPLRLVVHQDAVELHQPEGSVVERKVPLPVRWLKGFAEVQSHLSGMSRKFTLSRVQAQKFLRALPRAQADHEQWVTPAPQGARLSVRATGDGVMIKGTQRLRLFERLAADARNMDAWYNERQGSSAWVLDFGSQRLMMVLNSEPWRGFSGDGQLLSSLTVEDDPAVAAVKAQLKWQGALDPQTVANVTGHSRESVSRAMEVLAAQGLLGFDLTSGSYFHRVLPFDLSLLEQLNPRLKSAAALHRKGAVKLVRENHKVVAEVSSGGVVHRVSVGVDGNTCTCPWYAKHQDIRGPCKHILATELALDQQA